MKVPQLNKLLGNIDIYLLDQVLKNRFDKAMRILDAGCGEGRNLVYFLNNGFEVYGVDQNPDAIRMLQFVSGSINPTYPRSRFITADLMAMPFEDAYFDWVISCAVLHFARDQSHFEALFAEHDRVLKPGGSLFLRMTSQRGLENEVVPMCQAYDLGILAWSPLAQGVLAGRYKAAGDIPKGSRASQKAIYAERVTSNGVRVSEQVRTLAEEKGVSPTSLSVSWILHQPGITSVIIGPRTPEHLDDLILSKDLRLSPEDLAWFDSLVSPGTHVSDHHNTAGWRPQEAFGPMARWRERG